MLIPDSCEVFAQFIQDLARSCMILFKSFKIALARSCKVVLARSYKILGAKLGMILTL